MPLAAVAVYTLVGTLTLTCLAFAATTINRTTQGAQGLSKECTRFWIAS